MTSPCFAVARRTDSRIRTPCNSRSPEGKRAIGDSGYEGERTKVSTTSAGDSKEVKNFKARVKSRHETFNARIKAFKILSTPYRHGYGPLKDEEREGEEAAHNTGALKSHSRAFRSVCVAVQYDLENGHPLFEV
jgi:hypothetical protein